MGWITGGLRFIQTERGGPWCVRQWDSYGYPLHVFSIRASEQGGWIERRLNYRLGVRSLLYGAWAILPTCVSRHIPEPAVVWSEWNLHDAMAPRCSPSPTSTP